MMKKKGTTYCFLFGLLLVVNSVWGQTPEAALSILEKGKTISYDSLEHFIQPLRKDSVFIKTLSEANKNPMAQSFALNVLGMNARNKSDFKSAIALHQKHLNIGQSFLCDFNRFNMEKLFASNFFLGTTRNITIQESPG